MKEINKVDQLLSMEGVLCLVLFHIFLITYGITDFIYGIVYLHININSFLHLLMRLYCVIFCKKNETIIATFFNFFEASDTKCKQAFHNMNLSSMFLLEH